MIIDFVIRTLCGIFTGVLALMPGYTLPGSLTDVGNSVGSAVATLNGVFPVRTLGICLLAVVAARLFITAWAGITWVYARIPFKAT